MLHTRKRAMLWPPQSIGVKPQDVFKVVADTGANMDAAIAGIGFTPDLVISWHRDTADSMEMRDTARGMTSVFDIETSTAEYTFPGFSTYGSSRLTAYCFKKDQASLDIQMWTHTSGAADSRTLDLMFDPGLVILRRRAADNTVVWHKSTTKFQMNSQVPTATFGNLTVSGRTVTLASGAATGTYVLYAFADNPEIHNFSSFTCDASGNGVAALGWTPQMLFQKNISANAQHTWIDTTRGWPINTGNTAFTTNIPDKAVEQTTNYWINHSYSGSENVLVAPSNMTNAAWTQLDSPTITSATVGSFPTSTNTVPRIEQNYTGVAANDVWVYEIDASGSGSVEIHVAEETSAGVFANTVKVVTLSGTPTTYSIGRYLTSTSPVSVTARLASYNHTAATFTVSAHRLYRDTTASHRIYRDGAFGPAAVSNTFITWSIRRPK